VPVPAFVEHQFDPAILFAAAYDCRLLGA
jgi:hypothetical protein